MCSSLCCRWFSNNPSRLSSCSPSNKGISALMTSTWTVMNPYLPTEIRISSFPLLWNTSFRKRNDAPKCGGLKDRLVASQYASTCISPHTLRAASVSIHTLSNHRQEYSVCLVPLWFSFGSKGMVAFLQFVSACCILFRFIT